MERISSWKVGTSENPEMFTNTGETNTDRLKNEIKRMNYVQGSGSRVKMPNLHHSIKYDWKNDTHIFWASVSYVIYALGKSPVIDTGDVDISAYHEAVDNNDYTSGGITY